MRAGIGDFLRSRRARLTPEAVGLPAHGPRRTPGLRREEVAGLAGIGLDWYIRLEQGRAGTPSEATIAALAGALRLDETERRHLHALARGGPRAPFEREQVPDAIRRIVTDLDRPAYLTGQRWDLLVCNPAALRLFTGIAETPPQDRNLLRFLLLDPAARELFGAAWAGQAQYVVAQFRAAHDSWTPDPAFTGLAAQLAEQCPEFAGWWDRHDVAPGGIGRKVLHHPGGTSGWDYATFQASTDPALRLSVYTPA
ncbi:helix-turn-helix domain-containing protein [Amycolatopsis ultiminotia]|uniref:Helix-turn-helix domain-containing protein n=1 Tax=Amycolatopsis ultiminotia TaxID=543629 RepID=A0ABP6X7K2_9PSEU